MHRDEKTPNTHTHTHTKEKTCFFHILLSLLILCASFIFEVFLSLGDSCLDLIFTTFRGRCGGQSSGRLQFCLRKLTGKLENPAILPSCYIKKTICNHNVEQYHSFLMGMLSPDVTIISLLNSSASRLQSRQLARRVRNLGPTPGKKEMWKIGIKCSTSHPSHPSDAHDITLIPTNSFDTLPDPLHPTSHLRGSRGR